MFIEHNPVHFIDEGLFDISCFYIFHFGRCVYSIGKLQPSPVLVVIIDRGLFNIL